MVSWLFPTVLIGTALWAKSKRKAGAVRWVFKTEAEVKALPVGLVLEKYMEYGDELPAPSMGTTWKPVSILVATSPLTAPEEVVVHVLEPIVNGGGTAGFLTIEHLSGFGSTYLTTQEASKSPNLGSSYLTTQEVVASPDLGSLLCLGGG